MTQPMISDRILDEIELGARVADALARPVSTKQPEELKPALENAVSFNTGGAQETAMQNIDFDKLAGLLDSFSSRLTVDRLRSCDPTAAEHAVDAFFDLRDAVCSLRSAAGAQREAEMTEKAAA